MRPAYGCELRKLIFSPNDETSAGLAVHYVRQALELCERRMEIVYLDAARSEERPGAASRVISNTAFAPLKDSRMFHFHSISLGNNNVSAFA